MSDSNVTVPPAVESTGYPALLIAHCTSTAKWVNFIAILATVLYSLAIVAMLVLGAAGIAASSALPGAAYFGAGTSVAVFFIYLAVLGIYVPALVHLFRYAAALRDFVTGRETAQLERALGFQKSFWKYVGILAIVGVALVVVSLAFVVPLSRTVF
jgi:hypothetical protein